MSTPWSALLFLALPVSAHQTPGETAPAESQAASAQSMLDTLASWEGEWELEGQNGLTIRFESAASGHSVFERWETAKGLHSMTVYHLADGQLMATHYCPQGNQPRLLARSEAGALVFEFEDITDLDEGESYAHELTFAPTAKGNVIRTEVYLKRNDLRDAQQYVMRRKDGPTG